MHHENEKLRDIIMRRLDAWIESVKPRFCDSCSGDIDQAKMSITLHSPGYEDDGTLLLDARFDEELSFDYEEGCAV